MKVEFRLRLPDSAQLQTVNLRFYHLRESVTVSTGLKIFPKFWNFERERHKLIAGSADKDAINHRLDTIEGEAKRYWLDRTNNGGFSLADFKRHIQIFMGRVAAPDPVAAPIAKTFLEYFAAFIESSKTRIQGSGEQIHPRTIAKYKATFQLLEVFTAESRGFVAVENIGLDFYQRFTKWLSTRAHQRGVGYSSNAMGKHIQIIKTVLHDAEANALPINREFKNRLFKVTKEPTDAVYLDENELAQLATVDLSQNPGIDRSRDLFIVAAWSGLRFSDISTFSANPERFLRSNADGDFIEIEQYKTGEKVTIPVLRPVRAILEKYGGTLPRMISNQKFNDHIKEACRLAGLDQAMIKSITRGTRTPTAYRKWQLVSAHTARRSFATNAYKKSNGRAALAIMAITGHKSEKDFLIYIKASREEKANMVRHIFENEAAADLPKLKAV